MPLGISSTMADDIVTRTVSIVAYAGPRPGRRLFARLDAVSIADLAQLSGQRPGRSSFRLWTPRNGGYLFLDSGVVHAAELGEATGLEALAQMLSLDSGTFESCERDWPLVGNVSLEIGTALLRAQELNAARAPAEQDTVAVERLAVQVVDSIPIEVGVDDDHDLSLAALCRVLYRGCRTLEDALGLPSLTSARLMNDGWILLLFPEARAQRLSAVLGSRREARALRHSREPERRWPGLGHPTPDRGGLPSSLGELRALPGIIGTFVAAAGGELVGSSMPEALSRARVQAAASASETLLTCMRPAHFLATGAELRFGSRRLVVTRRGVACVGVVAQSSLSVPWLRGVAAHLARRLGEPPLVHRSVTPSPARPDRAR